MSPPLEGILVLDFTRLLPGPFATQLLANLGADVIKVEDPGVGDYMRAVPPTVQGLSYPFLMVNRGKRSLAVDLRTPEGREVLERLIPKADVLVEQFRPGVMKKFGADAATVMAKNPRLVYCSFSGFGQTGPAKDLPGHDITFEALAGILGVMGDREGRPVIPGVPIADLASAFNAAFSILAALRTRDRTGRGEAVDVSIFDTAVSLMILNFAHYFASGEEPVAGETILTGTFPFYNLYETADGRWLAVGAVEPKFWERLCHVLGLPEHADMQFGDPATLGRVRKDLASRFREKPLAEWVALLSTEDLPVAPVRRVSEVVKDPHVRERGLLPAIDVPRLWKTAVLAHPARHSASDVLELSKAPTKGEHTEEILRSLGYADDTIEGLARRGIIAR